MSILALWPTFCHLLLFCLGARLIVLPGGVQVGLVEAFLLPSQILLNSERVRKQGTNLEVTHAAATTTNRRSWIQRQFLVAFWSQAASAASSGAYYDGDQQDDASSTWTAVRADITLVTTTLQKLVTNWERAVVDCTYADVPRELLQLKNKELLLEKASTFALFDKSVSVTSCKTVNNRVREYLGRTGIGPVAGLENLFKQTTALVVSIDSMDVEEIDIILQTMEEIQRELIRADSLSYSARRDFSSMNNFDPEDAEKVLSDPQSNLALCKAAIEMAVDKLNALLKMLPT